MAVPARISMITIGVADVERAARFYADLGWARCTSSAEGVVAWFRTADTYLALFGTTNLAEDIGLPEPTEAPGFRAVALAINVDAEGDVARTLDAAAAAGGRVVKRATATIFGRNGYFADPDGHLWEVAYNPSFPIDPDGRITIP